MFLFYFWNCLIFIMLYLVYDCWATFLLPRYFFWSFRQLAQNASLGEAWWKISCFGIPALKSGINFFVGQKFLHLAKNCHFCSTKKGSIRYFFTLSRQWHTFLYKQHFCKQHQAEIWFEIIPISGTKKN